MLPGFVIFNQATNHCKWFGINGYQITGPNREIWLRSGWEEKDPNEYLTEIQVPVKKQ